MLVALDGTGFFSARRIRCDNCSTPSAPTAAPSTPTRCSPPTSWRRLPPTRPRLPLDERPAHPRRNDALRVNWLEITSARPDGTVTYRGSFVTSLHVDRDNIVERADCARARWKIENETFNDLKQHGEVGGGVQCEGEEVEDDEHAGEGVRAVAEVVLERCGGLTECQGLGLVVPPVASIDGRAFQSGNTWYSARVPP